MLKRNAEKLVENMQFFLHVPAWKLFLAIYGSIITIFLLNSVVHKIIYANATNFPFDVNYLFSFFYYFSLILLVQGVAVYFLWISTLFRGLYERFDNKDAINTRYMEVNLVIILITVFIFIPLINLIPNPHGLIMLVYYFAITYSFLTLIYGLFLIAKMLARVNDPDSSGEESIGIFLMLFFSFIGIFKLQPKIQEIFSRKPLPETEEAKLRRAEYKGD